MRSRGHPYPEIAPGGYIGQRMIERLDMQLRLPNSSRGNGIIIAVRTAGSVGVVALWSR